MTSEIREAFGRLYIGEDGLHVTFGVEDAGMTLHVVDDQEGQEVDLLFSAEETQRVLDFLADKGLVDSGREDDLQESYEAGREDGYEDGYGDAEDEATDAITDLNQEIRNLHEELRAESIS